MEAVVAIEAVSVFTAAISADTDAPAGVPNLLRIPLTYETILLVVPTEVCAASDLLPITSFAKVFAVVSAVGTCKYQATAPISAAIVSLGVPSITAISSIVIF